MNDVSVFALTRRDGSKKPWQVRWRCYGHYHSRQFTTKEPAKKFHAEMVLAAERDEPFNRETGLPWEPDDEFRPDTDTFYAGAVGFVARKRQGWAPKTRASAVEALEGAVRVLITEPIPDVLREPVRVWLVEVALLGHRLTDLDAKVRHDHDRRAHLWLLEHSQPLFEVTTEDAEAVLDAYARRLDGTPSAANTINRKRTQFRGLLKYAVRQGILDRDPLDFTEWTAPKTDKAVDVTLLPSPRDAQTLFGAVDQCGRTGLLLRPLFETVFYAGLRTGEARALKIEDLRITDLQPDGWGEIVVVRSLTSPGARHTNSGQTTEERALKWRAKKTKRTVPIPPVLVDTLRQHLNQHPPGGDRVFSNLNGRAWDNGRISRVWRQAKEIALPTGSPLLSTRPYDLRHANVSMLIAAHVPIPEVALRLGHSVEVLLSTYANVINGDRDRANRLIDDYLATG